MHDEYYTMSEDYYQKMTECGNVSDGIKYVMIPKIILFDNSLSPLEKLVYSYISSVGRCWASNEHLAKLFGSSERTISRTISNLIDNGYIEFVGYTGRFRVLVSCVDGKELRRLSGMDN